MQCTHRAQQGWYVAYGFCGCAVPCWHAEPVRTGSINFERRRCCDTALQMRLLVVVRQQWAMGLFANYMQLLCSELNVGWMLKCCRNIVSTHLLPANVSVHIMFAMFGVCCEDLKLVV